ncbi:MAG: ADP-ribosylglycohydrolase family protein, partial [Planctomycetes bacterium]|nr:ADP-ribosylglycohydrolase family protein [Planctomycetota bacterium]
MKGKADFESCGHLAGRLEAYALPRAVPVGLFGPDQPESLPELVAPVSSITHRDPLVAAAAAALAAAVAGLVVSTEIILGRLLDQMSQAAGRFHGDTAER